MRQTLSRQSGRVPEDYGKNGRTVHGFLFLRGRGVRDESTISGLKEIEMWLAEADKHHQCSLSVTSAYFLKFSPVTQSTRA
jgi:hypothetical protein